MRTLLAIDWGTSSLRGALLDAQGRMQGERGLPRGIMTVPPGAFPAVLRDTFGDWLQRCDLALICGMAGSRQGWMEAPYCPCPAGFADVARQLAWVEPGRIAIVPGLSCEHDGVPDVMRGEETQVLGALQLLGIRDGLLVLPGTHSKWVRVREGRVTEFVTCMTGEFYALLRRHSILVRSMPDADAALDEAAFQQGLAQARHSPGLLQSAFSARTLSLFGRMDEAELPSYLSGLVIGDELRSQDLAAVRDPVVVIGSPELTARYALALQAWGIDARRIGSEATWRGLLAIARTLEQP